MKLWRWFVGQVARLRRSAVGVPASGSHPPHADYRLSEGPAPGPPAHWVERVRRGAPGLLEPSLRRRGGPVEPPPAGRIALSQTELDPEPESFEEPERGYVRTEPTVAPRRPEAPVRAPLWRKVFRMPSHSAPPVAPATAPHHVSHEIDTATRRANNPRDSPAEPERVPPELEAATRRVSNKGHSL